MDDAHQIVLRAVEQAGVYLPPGVDSVQDITSSALVSICSQALALIRGGGVATASSTSLPQAMSERFRICTDLATAIQQLGYRGDLNFHQFLYPSEEETHKVLRFLLDNLSKSSSSTKDHSGRKGRGKRIPGEDIDSSKTETKVRRALSVWLEAANQHSKDGKNMSNRQEDADASLADGEESSCVHDDRTSSTHHRVPFRTCPLRLASSNTSPPRKTPALITLQAKPKTWLVPSVLELNVKNALNAARVLDDQLANLIKDVGSFSIKENGEVKVVSKGSLQIKENTTGHDEIAYSTSFLMRAVKFSEKWDHMRLHQQVMEADAKRDVEEVSKNEAASADSLEDLQQWELTKLEKKLSHLSVEASQMDVEARELEQHARELEMEHEHSLRELETLEDNCSLLKAAVDIVFESTNSKDSKVQELQWAIQERQQYLAILRTEWESVCSNLEEKQASLETSAERSKGEIQLKLKQMKEIRQQIKDINARLRRREEQRVLLTTELESIPKGATRNTYIRRITELVKNSKKQDSDISRIISETRDLQRESNANQGRLRRTHALVDELVFRDAKKDQVCRQAYRLLSSMHENFADCFEKVFARDKLHREIADLEATLETLEKWPVDTSKVQADIDAIVAENQFLEKKLKASFDP